MSDLEKQIAECLGFRIDESGMFADGWSTDKRHWLLWNALLSARKRIAELEATFPSEEEIECQAHMTRDSVGGIAGFLACADWLRERLGVK